MVIEKNPFKRYCDDCDDFFQPTSNQNKFCKSCLTKRRKIHNKSLTCYRTHNCPFLKDNKYCTHKDITLYNRKAGKRLCSYSKKDNCKLYRDCSSKLKLNKEGSE